MDTPIRDIQPGDIVTGYHKGFHIVTEIHMNIVYYTRIDKNMKNCCNISYCEIIDPDEYLEQQIKAAHELREQMINAKKKWVDKA